MKQITTGVMALSVCVVLLGALAPATFAQTPAKKTTTKMTKAKAKNATAEVKYKAQCGMIYSAADAKKNHYICPMDHKPLVKMASATKSVVHKK